MDAVEISGNAHKKQKIKILRAKNIISKKRVIYEFKGKYRESFGCPERHAKWFITGPSYSGKSSFLFELAGYLAQYGKVDYNSQEEAGGDSQTIANKIVQADSYNVDALNRKIAYYKAPIISDELETFEDRLRKKRSAAFAILDSIQHAELTRKQYLKITNYLSNPRHGKSLLFVSHWVKNDFVKFVKHDCDIKIEIIGFVASVDSRYGGGKPFLIWEEAAKKYWGKKYNQIITGKYWPGRKK